MANWGEGQGPTTETGIQEQAPDARRVLEQCLLKGSPQATSISDNWLLIRPADSTESEGLGVGLAIWDITSLPGDSDACQRLKTTGVELKLGRRAKLVRPGRGLGEQVVPWAHLTCSGLRETGGNLHPLGCEPSLLWVRVIRAHS